jgi:hypothetical protein
MSSYTISIPVIQNVNKTYTVEKKKSKKHYLSGRYKWHRFLVLFTQYRSR